MGTTMQADGLSRVLFGSVRREVLALLLGRPDERFYFREILRTAGGGSGAVQRELKQLVEAGLVTRESSGRQVYFSANRQAAIFPELQAIMEKTAGAVEVLRAALAPFIGNGRIDVALVYGSVASGTQTAGSDVDLLILGGVTLAELVPALRIAEGRLHREVNPSVYPVNALRAKRARGAAFLSRVMAGPKLFVVGDDRDFGRLGEG